MNSIALVNITRFILLMALQILVLRQMNYGPIFGGYLRVFMYPLFLLLLPYRMTVELAMIIGFATGLLVDVAYDTFGIHASTAVALIAIRTIIIQRLEPKGGYNLNKGLTPDSYGWTWFAKYIIYCYLFFALWLSILEVFQIWKVLEILLRAVLILPVSIFFIFISIQVFNPRN